MVVYHHLVWNFGVFAAWNSLGSWLECLHLSPVQLFVPTVFYLSRCQKHLLLFCGWFFFHLSPGLVTKQIQRKGPFQFWHGFVVSSWSGQFWARPQSIYYPCLSFSIVEVCGEHLFFSFLLVLNNYVQGEKLFCCFRLLELSI